jgi:2,3-bisphosphoglycerate-independent phosphoglycerate mutase
VPPTSALLYVDRFEAFLADLTADGGPDYAIASGGGRMKVTMDRYEADWRIVERGWTTHVRGEGRRFASARAAIEAFRKETPGVVDQDLPPFVIERDGRPLGPIADGDGVILFNFRGDRAIEISRAFEEETFDRFPRGPRPEVAFAGMMRYDGDLQIPKNYLVEPPAIDRTMGEYLARAGIRQLAISETQKFGHVTYFFNGNRSGKFDERTETYVEIPSDRVPFEQRPWMKAAEITDRVLEEIRAGGHRFVRINLANGDMVGHTGVFEAVRIAVETVDLCVGRIARAVAEAGGILVVTADHGNADDMVERDRKTGLLARDARTGEWKPKTAHSLNRVPFYIEASGERSRLRLAGVPDAGISNLAATCLRLLGFEPPADYTPSLVEIL